MSKQELLSTTKSQSVEVGPFDGLIRVVTDTADQTADVMALVGQAAGEITTQSSEALRQACLQAVAEIKADLQVIGPDADTVKAEIKAALSTVLRSQSETPRDAVALLMQTHQRIKQLTQRCVDVAVGKRLLPVVERLTRSITEADIASAHECSEKMEAMERLFGQPERPSTLTEAGRKLAEARWQK